MERAAAASHGRARRNAAARNAMVAERSAPFRLLVRIGFVTRGVTYGVIGGITMALAAGAGAAPAAPSQQGALSLIAHAPAGAVALAVMAVGVLFYALWKLGEGVLGQLGVLHPEAEPADLRQADVVLEEQGTDPIAAQVLNLKNLTVCHKRRLRVDDVGPLIVHHVGAAFILRYQRARSSVADLDGGRAHRGPLLDEGDEALGA